MRNDALAANWNNKKVFIYLFNYIWVNMYFISTKVIFMVLVLVNYNNNILTIHSIFVTVLLTT